LLSDFDRRVVREAVEDLETARDAGAGPRVGWALGAVGLVVIVGWWRFGGAVPAAQFVSPFVWLGGLLCALGGAVLALTGGAGGRRAAQAAVEAALRRLEDPASDRETVVRAAVLLLWHGSWREGTTTSPTFEAGPARERIGAVMPIVEEVERALVGRNLVASIFTLARGETFH